MVEKVVAIFVLFLSSKIEQYFADSSLTITILVRVVGCQTFNSLPIILNIDSMLVCSTFIQLGSVKLFDSSTMFSRFIHRNLTYK